MPPIRLGVLCWNQYTDWPSLLEAGRRADRLGFDTLWTWVHSTGAVLRRPILSRHPAP